MPFLTRTRIVIGLAFALVYGYLIKFVFVPFCLYDKLQDWDIPGHIQAAWFIRHYSFPWYEGWNPFFFAGHPNDTYYGPTHHYLLALLNFVLPMESAFKVLTVLSISLLPLAFYYFARRLGFDGKESALQMILMFVPMAFINIACGGNLFSMFNVGLVSNALAFPFFFVYLGKLHCTLAHFETLSRPQIRRAFIILALLLALITLTHFVVCFAALMALGVETIYYLKKDSLRFAIWHGLCGLLLSGFWLIPLMLYKNYVLNPGTVLNMGFFMSLPLFIVALFGYALAVHDRDARFTPQLYLLLATFAVAAFIDFGEFGLPMHSYRFIPFYMPLLMLGCVKYFFNQHFSRRLRSVVLLGFVLVFGFYFYKNLKPEQRDSINKNRLYQYQADPQPMLPRPDLGNLDGRVLIIDYSSEKKPRLLPHYLAMSTGQAQFISGLFMESAPNGVLLNALVARVTTFTLGHGSSWIPRSRSDLAELAYFDKQFKSFGINYILSAQAIQGLPLERQVAIRPDRPAYALHTVGHTPLVSVLSESPVKTAKKDWSSALDTWTRSLTDTVYAETDQSLPAFVTLNPLPTISGLITDWKHGELRFHVDSDAAVPVLVRVSYFPRWRAYCGKQPLRVYRVSPGLMLVYAQGDTRLHYGPASADWMGIAVSLFGIGILFSLKNLFS